MPSRGEEAKIEEASLSFSPRREENSVSKVSRVMNANSCARYELKRLLQIDPPIEKLLSLLFLSFFFLRRISKMKMKMKSKDILFLSNLSVLFHC